MDGIVVIWVIVALGILAMFLVYAWGSGQRAAGGGQRLPSYWELQRIAYKHGLPPGYHTIDWQGRPFGFLVADHNRVEADPRFGAYWRVGEPFAVYRVVRSHAKGSPRR
jgi:hypothetical protein